MHARMSLSRQRALPLAEHRMGEDNKNEKKHDCADDGEFLLMRAARQVQFLSERRQHQRRHRQQKQRRDHSRRLTFEVKHAELPTAGDKGKPENQERVRQNGADQRRLHDGQQSGPEREDADEQFGEIADRRLNMPVAAGER